jgi:pimeloyl-ACP methyl ester carboxylesterase
MSSPSPISARQRLLVTALLIAALSPLTAEAEKAPQPDPAPAAAPAPLAGFWEASIALPNDQALEVSFFIEQDAAGAWSGTISIPAQMVEGMALASVTVSGDALAWVMPLPGVPEAAWPRAAFTLSADREAATGTFTQGLAKLAITATASDPVKLRPQTPQPPFPYTSREVSFTSAADPKQPVKLTGTLTIPAGDGPHPAALLITGSGQQDRDETIFGHKPFWVIADHLSRHGVAVLRVDDRGTGASEAGDLRNATTLTFAADADAALDFLKAQAGVDPKRVGTVGHSEGGLISVVVAARRPDIAFSVLLAASTLPGLDILLRQNADIARAAGANEAQVAAIVDAQRAVLQAAIDGKDDAALLPLVAALLVAQTAYTATPLTLEQATAAAQPHLAPLRSPWMRTFLTLDARDHLPKIQTPILALNGTLDLQVAHDPNLGAIRDAAAASGNAAITTAALPDLNHLFQTAKTGQVSEYATIRETFAPAALKRLSDWIPAQPPLP